MKIEEEIIEKVEFIGSHWEEGYAMVFRNRIRKNYIGCVPIHVYVGNPLKVISHSEEEGGVLKLIDLGIVERIDRFVHQLGITVWTPYFEVVLVYGRCIESTLPIQN